MSIEEMFEKRKPGATGDTPEDLEKLREAVNAVFSSGENMALKSSLNSNQVAHLIRMNIFAEEFNSDAMRKIIVWCLKYKVSDKGLGRKNLTDVLKSMLRGRDETMSDQDIRLRRKLFG
jgi:hypothetical protein